MWNSGRKRSAVRDELGRTNLMVARWRGPSGRATTQIFLQENHLHESWCTGWTSTNEALHLRGISLAINDFAVYLQCQFGTAEPRFHNPWGHSSCDPDGRRGYFIFVLPSRSWSCFMLSNRLRALSLLGAAVGLSASAQSTTATLTATPVAASYGTAINLSAVITSGGGSSIVYPSGSVAFDDGSANLGKIAITADIFTRPSTIPLTQLVGAVGNSVGSFISGDVNGDGKQDLISYSSVAFQVFVNTGGGTYTALPVNANSVVSPALLDYNGDGKIDIVSVAASGSGLYGQPTGLTILLGDGAGSFQSPTAATNIALPVNANVTALAAADLTGQGRADLAIFYNFDNMFSQCVAPSCEAGAHVSVYVNQGAGSFDLRGTTILADTESFYSFVDFTQTEDFNRDGKPDLVISAPRYGAGSQKGTRIDVLLSDGNGTFTRSTAGLFDSMGSGCSQPAFATGDFANRGQSDIIASYISAYGTPSAGQYQLVRFAGYGDGTFAAGTVVATLQATSCGGTAAVDLDGDGKLDVVEGSGFLLHGNGDGTFATAVNASPTMKQPFTVIYGTGPVVVTPSTGKPAVILNGKGSTAAAIPVLIASASRSAVLGPITNLAAGTHSITATYAANGSFTGSTSAPVLVTISKQTATVTGSATPTTALVTQPVTLSVKITISCRPAPSPSPQERFRLAPQHWMPLAMHRCFTPSPPLARKPSWPLTRAMPTLPRPRLPSPQQRSTPSP